MIYALTYTGNVQTLTARGLELMQDGAGGGYWDNPNIVDFYAGAI